MRYGFFNLLSSLFAIFAVCFLVFTPFTAHSQGKPDEREGYSDKADAVLLTVRAHDIVDGFGGREIVIDLRLSEGTDFEIHRKKD